MTYHDTNAEPNAAFTIAKRAEGYHVTVERPCFSGVFGYIGWCGDTAEVLDAVFETIEVELPKRLILAPFIADHLANKPCDLIDVEFSADGIIDVNCLHGGVTTDAFHIHPNNEVRRLVD